MNKIACYLGYGSWCGLGFYRGIREYNHTCKKDYLYTKSLFSGLFGTIIYANPGFIPILIFWDSIVGEK
jgi:hypothetical protein